MPKVKVGIPSMIDEIISEGSLDTSPSYCSTFHNSQVQYHSLLPPCSASQKSQRFLIYQILTIARLLKIYIFMRLHKHLIRRESLLHEILKLPRSKWPDGVGGRGKVPQDPQF